MRAVARKRAAIDPASREGRSRLAAMVTKLLDHWSLTTAEQAEALGLSAASRSTLGRYRSGEPLADNRDLLDRAGHLLGIHKSLRILFPHDRDLAYRWMTNSQCPVSSHMARHLSRVCKYFALYNRYEGS